MANMSTLYVDRDEASTILKVSTRTLDRYIRKFRFKTRKDGRRVLIKREDVDQIIQDQIGQFIEQKKANLDKQVDNQNYVHNEAAMTVKDIKVESVKTPERTDSKETVYQNLYQEAKKELKEKQERLDAATYRVGQLESQVKSMVPMLDYSRKEKELKEAKYTLEQKEIEKADVISRMEQKIRNERMAKWLYISLAGLLLVVEPILFLVWAFS